MKTDSLFKLMSLCGVISVGPLCSRAEVPAPASDRILQQELKQQQIRAATQKVGEQLAAIITEFERNQISGEEVKVLQAIRSVLGKLSAEEMEKVISLLREARTTDDAVGSTRRVADAFSGQKTIITQLRQLLLEYQRQQALYELAVRLKELAARQTGNMRLGVGLAKSARGNSINDLGENQKLSLQLQHTEQNALKDEVGLVVTKLEKMTGEVDGGATMDRPKAAMQQAKEGALSATLDAAVSELKTARILSAVGNEKKARDVLREMARVLAQSKDRLEALRQALKDLDQAIEQQHQVMDQTKKLEKNESTKVEGNQADVVDATDLIRKDVESLAPAATDDLKNSIDKMQEARAVLASSQDHTQKRKATPPKQQEAIRNLEQARRSLTEQLAKAEAESQPPENALASLKELQQEVRELIAAEEKVKKESAELATKPTELREQAPKQGEVKDKAQEVQQRAASSSPNSAQSLSQAGEQMQKSQQSLANSQNAPEAQQAALDALSQADQQLSQEIAKLEQAEQELAALEELLKKLIAVIEGQQKVQLNTAKAAVGSAGFQPAGSGASLPRERAARMPPEPAGKDAGATGAMKELATEQATLGKSTGELQQEAAKPVPTAANYLGDAQRDMNAAKEKLELAEANTAQPPQTQALVNLYRAKKEIEAKIEELQKMLGMPPEDSSQSLEDAAAKIAKAQQEVNEAMAQMTPPGLMESLLQQQKQIASGLNELTPNAASLPEKQAQKSATQAAQQLASSNLKSAIDSMKKTQDALQQAVQSKPAAPAKPPTEKSRAGESSPTLPQLSQKQADVQKLAEQLAAAQQAAPNSALDKAAQLLGEASEDIGPLTAGEMGPLPRAAQSALQEAQGALSSGTAQASAHNTPGAQAHSSTAADALAQAQAALALAQAGLGSQMASGQNQGQGKGQGQGKTPGQGQGKGQGQGQTPGQGNGNQGNWAGKGGDGQRQSIAGTSQFLGLPKRDRAAIQQSQSEKYPQEYGSLVEQYLKNLSDEPVESKK